MITSKFIEYAMKAVLVDVTFYLGENSTKSHKDLGEMKINYYEAEGTNGKTTTYTNNPTITESPKLSGTWETKSPARYCIEPQEGKSYTVSCINSQSGDKIFCSIPFQGSATVTKGYQIKINPYVSEKRGIQVTFSEKTDNN